MGGWNSLASRVDEVTEETHIALVGKYTGLQDSYLSVLKALKHAAIAAGRLLVIDWVEATFLELASKENSPAKYEESWKVGDDAPYSALLCSALLCCGVVCCALVCLLYSTLPCSALLYSTLL